MASRKSNPSRKHQPPTPSVDIGSASTRKLIKPAAVPKAPRVGEILDGRWRLERELGKGGFGAVYEAVHMGNGKRAAVKILHGEDAHDEKVVKLFFREGLVDNQVNDAARVPMPHGPGAVAAYDGGISVGGSPYLVLELLRGETLDKLRQRAGGRLPAATAAPLIADVLHTLEAAHQQGIVHRDVKPENIMLTPEGDVHVLDWGLARTRGKGPQYAGPGVGTIGYASPQQVAGQKVDGRADVWGASATLYALLSGRYPVARTEQSLSDPFSQCPVPPLRVVAPEVPKAVAAVVDKGLRCNPDERWPTAAAMGVSLRKAAHVRGLAEEELAKRRSRAMTFNRS